MWKGRGKPKKIRIVCEMVADRDLSKKKTYWTTNNLGTGQENKMTLFYRCKR